MTRRIGNRPRTVSRPRFALGLAAVVALLALVGSACQPVQSLGATSYLNPVGVLDGAVGGSGVVRVTGWAAEWTQTDGGSWMKMKHPPAPTKIVVMVGGQWVPQVFDADAHRPDVDRAFLATGEVNYRRPGALYGFDITVPADPGETDVCVVALNTLYEMATDENWHFGGDHVLLGCRAVTVT